MATSSSLAPGREVDRLGQAVVDEGLHGGLHAHVLVGGDVAGDDEDVADVGGHLGHILAGAAVPSLRSTIAWRFSGSIPASDQGLFEERAGVGQLQVLAVVVDVADVGQGEDRLAAVAFAAGHGGDGAGGGDGGLGGVADAVLADAGRPRCPIDGRAAKIVRVGAPGGRAAAS